MSLFLTSQKKKSIEKMVFQSNRSMVDVTIILNIWKRAYLEEQLIALLSQTVIPKEIWILQLENHQDIDSLVNITKLHYSNIVTIKSDRNFKYFGRFSLAVNVLTKYTWILDDDVIPGKKWLEKCVQKCKELNAIVSCTGRIIPKNNFEPENYFSSKRKNHFIGDMSYTYNKCVKDTPVDYACNSYFFKSKWIKLFWSIWPKTFQTGEDIHLSASCKILRNVPTFVLKQGSKNESGSIKKEYGADDYATWKRNDFIERRRAVIKHHVKKNHWKPINW